MTFCIVLLLWMLITSGIAAILYAIDKRAAGKNARRVPENTLLLWSAAGGWPGAVLAGRKLRHKTHKMSYRIYFGGAIIANLAVVGLLAWFFLLRS